MDSVVKVQNLQKRYGENIVLKGVSFDVKRGEIFALLGTNGAGKKQPLNVLKAYGNLIMDIYQ